MKVFHHCTDVFFCEECLPAILCILFFRTELLNGSPVVWQGLAGGNVGDLQILLRGDFYFDWCYGRRHCVFAREKQTGKKAVTR